jgi:hypothetical protein
MGFNAIPERKEIDGGNVAVEGGILAYFPDGRVEHLR